MKQVIYSRYQYAISKDVPTSEIFDEYSSMFKPGYNERGVQVEGVGVAIDLSSRHVILLVYSLDAEIFLKLKFLNRSDVKVNRYY